MKRNISLNEVLGLSELLSTIDKLTLINNVTAQIKTELKTIHSEKNNVLLGLFADDVALMNQVTESAMQARERDPLRHT
ncbi:hypothetical protein GMMP15_290013 [Candidatus Magnetomoraceae bacterium gMMP-15]